MKNREQIERVVNEFASKFEVNEPERLHKIKCGVEQMADSLDIICEKQRTLGTSEGNENS